MKNLLKDCPGKQIKIISGEGTGPGNEEIYTGKRTQRAIKSRLTRERCGGDRWAYFVIHSHDLDTGKVGINLETFESCPF